MNASAETSRKDLSPTCWDSWVAMGCEADPFSVGDEAEKSCGVIAGVPRDAGLRRTLG